MHVQRAQCVAPFRATSVIYGYGGGFNVARPLWPWRPGVYSISVVYLVSVKWRLVIGGTLARCRRNGRRVMYGNSPPDGCWFPPAVCTGGRQWAALVRRSAAVFIANTALTRQLKHMCMCAMLWLFEITTREILVNVNSHLSDSATASRCR